MSRTFELMRQPYQSNELLDASTLSKWEQSTGQTLPDDYKRFLLRTNGGSLRPYTFLADVKTPSYTAPREHTLEVLFDWKMVLDESQLDIPPRLRNTPPGFLAIAGLVGDHLFLMISLSPQDHGAVVAWPKDFFNSWGEGPNDRVVPIAPNFTAFLGMLHDVPPGEGYHSAWDSSKDPDDVIVRIEL